MACNLNKSIGFIYYYVGLNTQPLTVLEIYTINGHAEINNFVQIDLGTNKSVSFSKLKKIIKKAIIGEISMPIGGSIRRIGSSTGSVVRIKNCTSGLNGSGLTQLIKARIKINQYMMVKRILTIAANASIKLPNTNI